MDKKRIKVNMLITFILIIVTSSCSQQFAATKNNTSLKQDSLKIEQTKNNVPSLYRNLKDINGGKKLKVDFNLSSSTPHPNTTKNKNNAKNTVLSDHTIKSQFSKPVGVKLVHRN